MKKHITAMMLLCLLIIGALQAQHSSLYVPLDIQKAYKKGTRSNDGTVSTGYWQNRSDYKIKVELERPRMLNGSETITYYNNSPDTLRHLVIRLYQDRYRKNNMRDDEVADIDLHDGVEIKRLAINNQPVPVKDNPGVRRYGTNMIVMLPQPLLPKSQATIETAWSSQIPIVSDTRTGIYNDSSYFVAYWYPQVAVYDDVDGWDTFNYMGTQEFYNDFGNFDVEITAPQNFVVWATGVLQNPGEVLADKFLARYKTAQTADKVINIIKAEDLDKKGFTRGAGKNTWKFKADYVPDFAFASSSSYLWDATSVTVEKGRRVITEAVYDKGSADFYEVAQVAQQTVASLSTHLPGIPFPYPHVTVFNGQGGMEFPMMVNDGSVREREEMVYVTSHEIAHTYFPFYMGINERKYAWMDEGWAQTLPNDFQQTATAAAFKPNDFVSKIYLMAAGKEQEMPLSVPSTMLTGMTYSISAYMRPAMAYMILRDLLGEEKFKKALKEYMHRWNGKHPIPYDFFNSFESASGEKLDWYWKPWFFEAGYPDLSIKDVSSSNNKLKFTVEKKGSLPVPVSVKVTFTDGTEDIFRQTAAVWKEGKTTLVIEKEYKKAVSKIELGDGVIPDVDTSDNLYNVAQ